jgi:hypothetical protein
MDKLVLELINLLRGLLLTHQRLLQIALIRQEAMRVFDIERLNSLVEEERAETQNNQTYESLRKTLIGQFRQKLNVTGEPSVSDIARHCVEPAKTQLLALAAQLRDVVDQLARHTRINARISEGVVKGLAKVLTVMTGLAQHAGLYLRTGRKAAPRGVHLLEVTG